MHIMGVGLVRSLQLWDTLVIYHNNQFRKHITPLLTLARGAFSAHLLMSMSEALSVPFHFNKTLLHRSSWVIKPGPGPQSWIFLRDHGSNMIHRKLSPELAQILVHWVSDAIQPSHPLLSPSPAFNLSQDQGLFQWVSSSCQVAKILELQLQH